MQPHISLAMLSLVGASTFYSPFMPISWYINIAKRSGFDGIEYWPIRLIPELQVNLGLLSQEEKRAITSCHQSFIDAAETFSEVTERYGLVMSLIMYILLPPHVSVQILNKLIKTIKRDIPTVVFLETPQEIMKTLNSKKKVVQPAGRLFQKIDIQSIDDFFQLLDSRDMEVCLDTHHFRVQAKNTCLYQWEKSLPKLLKRTTHVHISAGRTDEPDDVMNTMKELRALLTGDYKNELFDILREIKKSGYTGNYVLEIPLSSLEKLTNEKMTPRKLIKHYSRILENVRNVLT